MDLSAIGGALAAVSAIATGAWAWWLKNQRAQAATRADVAEANAAAAVADAQGTVYKLLLERVETLESEMRTVRAELASERQHSRRLEVKLIRLEQWIRAQGLTPPEFTADDMKIGGTD